MPTSHGVCPARAQVPPLRTVLRMADQFDVVIVGGGPAGCVAAIALRALNPSLTVSIVDKKNFPRDKTCGDGLGPGAVRILRKLDILDEVVEGFASPTGVCIAAPGKWEAHAPVQEVRGVDLAGYVIPREQLDVRMVEIAQRRGVQFFGEATFRSSELVEGGRTVRLTTSDGDRELHARLLVGADGAYSVVRRDLGVAKASDRSTLIAVRSYCRLDLSKVSASAAVETGYGIDDSLRFDFVEEYLPTYGWVFPVSSTVANVGVGLPMTLFQQRGVHTKELLSHYLTHLRSRGYPVSAPSEIRAHHLPHGAELPRLTHQHAVLIGDAASMINPISGEGIFYGMAAGLMLAEQLAHWVDGDPERHVAAFEASYRQRFSRHFASCVRAAKILSSRWRARSVIKAAARNRRVMDDIALMLFDEQRLTVGTVARVVKAMV